MPSDGVVQRLATDAECLLHLQGGGQRRQHVEAGEPPALGRGKDGRQRRRRRMSPQGPAVVVVVAGVPHDPVGECRRAQAGAEPMPDHRRLATARSIDERAHHVPGDLLVHAAQHRRKRVEDREAQLLHHRRRKCPAVEGGDPRRHPGYEGRQEELPWRIGYAIGIAFAPDRNEGQLIGFFMDDPRPIKAGMTFRLLRR